MAVTAALVVAGLGAAASFQQGRQQAKQQKKAAAAQRRAEGIRAVKARKESIREASIKRAQLVANVANSVPTLQRLVT